MMNTEQLTKYKNHAMFDALYIKTRVGRLNAGVLRRGDPNGNGKFDAPWQVQRQKFKGDVSQMWQGRAEV